MRELVLNQASVKAAEWHRLVSQIPDLVDGIANVVKARKRRTRLECAITLTRFSRTIIGHYGTYIRNAGDKDIETITGS